MFAIFQGIAFNEKVINYFDTLYEMYANNDSVLQNIPQLRGLL